MRQRRFKEIKDLFKYHRSRGQGYRLKPVPLIRLALHKWSNSFSYESLLPLCQQHHPNKTQTCLQSPKRGRCLGLLHLPTHHFQILGPPLAWETYVHQLCQLSSVIHAFLFQALVQLAVCICIFGCNYLHFYTSNETEQKAFEFIIVSQ